MRRITVVGGAALLLATLGWATPHVWLHRPALRDDRAGPTSGQIYTLAEVSAGIVHHSRRWNGATVWVRGMVIAVHRWRALDGGEAFVALPLLTDPASGALALPLRRGAPDPLWVTLRRLPLLGGVLPRPQPVRWNQVATYHIHLRVLPGGACLPCYTAMLLDPA